MYSTFVEFFAIAITNFTPTCEIWTHFLKIIHQKWKYYRKKNKILKDFKYFLISKCRQNPINLNSVRNLWLCGKKNSRWRCSVKRVFLEISQTSQESLCARVSFANIVAGLAKVLRILFLTEHLWETASKVWKECRINFRVFQTNIFE